MSRKALLVFMMGCLYLKGDTQTVKPAGGLHDDSATAAASLQYADPSFFDRLFLGKNYRSTWATPVTLPLFHLKEMGFTIKELGGGQQTKSLRLLDPQGREWALRSVDKVVKPEALPKGLRNKLFISITQEMVSASYPYAPLTIPTLARATDVVAANPTFYFVPDDPALGEYRPLFANTMCMLEEREPTPDHTDTKNTGKVVENMLEKNKYLIDEEAVLRARLLDMLIADWDRHQDQWRWGVKKKAGQTYYYAIPRDRDQAFFNSTGLLVRLARIFALKHMVGFTTQAHKLRKLNAKSWNFDRVFLNELSRRDWERIATEFQSGLTDEVIKKAVAQLPPAIYQLDGAEVEKKLLGRRNTLKENVMDYYRFLAQYVTISGTDDDERFHISGNKDSLTVTLYDAKNTRLYQRTFYPGETQAINLIGLGGKDEFVVDKGVRSKIKLNMDGGKGENNYVIGSGVKKEIYHSDTDAKEYEKKVKKLLKIKEEG